MEKEKEIQFNGKYNYGLGRRKTAVAQVRLYKGKGNVVINNRDAREYLRGFNDFIKKINAPLVLTGHKDKFDISIKVKGGGISSQTDAILLGIARALLSVDGELKSTLRKVGYLTRDPRKKERNKPGLKGARKAPQFSKR